MFIKLISLIILHYIYIPVTIIEIKLKLKGVHVNMWLISIQLSEQTQLSKHIAC